MNGWPLLYLWLEWKSILYNVNTYWLIWVVSKNELGPSPTYLWCSGIFGSMDLINEGTPILSALLNCALLSGHLEFWLFYTDEAHRGY
ncbi:hypothetical protein QJS04_geneDACA007309 [Acorus gramineus]|uniref:Uncharacterized protein n=1 Tax=Acorus gramineus TaxID=55184 RepID=A0AAV9BPC3_ACOGR|nr:hypothetical protein QJS04_geneDACA007309 [Acorus gramineus]